MITTDLKKYCKIAIPLFILYTLLVTKTNGKDDVYWIDWSIYMFKYGLAKIYNSGANYLPLYYYIIEGYVSFQNTAKEVFQNIYMLKFFTIPFYFISGFYLTKMLRDKIENPYERILLSLFYIANISFLYNCLIWGQIDEIYTCFIFLSFYYTYKEKVLLSILFLLIALNFKIQAIIFVPGILMLLIPVVIRLYSSKKILLWIFIPLITQLFILKPYIMEGNLDKVWYTITSAMGTYPSVSLNAFNIWHLLISGNLMNVSNELLFLKISYKNWGLLLFFIFSFAALFPLILSKIRYFFNRKEYKKLDLDSLLLIFSLIPLLFFYLNTEMHERYSYPAYIFLTTFCVRNKKIFLLIIASFAHILNLEIVQKHLNLTNYDTALIFNSRFISILFLIVIFFLYKYLYNSFLRVSTL